jgi:hypothetical protein
MSEIVAKPSAREPTILNPAPPTLTPPRRAPAGDPRQKSLRLRRSGRSRDVVPSTDIRRRVFDLRDSYEPEALIGRPSEFAACAGRMRRANLAAESARLQNEPRRARAGWRSGKGREPVQAQLSLAAVWLSAQRRWGLFRRLPDERQSPETRSSANVSLTT